MKIELNAAARLTAARTPVDSLVVALEPQMRPIFKRSATGPTRTAQGDTYYWGTSVGEDDELSVNAAEHNGTFCIWIGTSYDDLDVEVKGKSVDEVMQKFSAQNFVKQIKDYIASGGNQE